MNWDQIKGDWKQFTGKVKEKWGKLIDDDLTTIAGQRDQMIRVLHELWLRQGARGAGIKQFHRQHETGQTST